MTEIENTAEVQDYLMSHAKVLDFKLCNVSLHKTPSTCNALRRPLKELYFNGQIADLSDATQKISLPPSISMFWEKESLSHFDFSHVESLYTSTYSFAQQAEEMLETEVFRSLREMI